MMEEYVDLLLKFNNKYQKLRNKKNIIIKIIINDLGNKNEVMIKNINNKIYFNINIVFYIFILIILIIPIISQNMKLDSNRLLQSEIYEITIKFNGIGNQEILYNCFNTMPDKIYSSNGDEIERNENKINIEDNELYYTLKWENYLTDCSFLFCNLSNIIEVDLSRFNPSHVLTMKEMFSGCINLKKIMIGNNFNSLIVKDVYKMFFNCASLTSLDLSNFDTSNLNKMNNMFYNCKSLKNLDISQFNTSSVTRMEKLFKNCELITSLNLKNFITNLVTNMESLFEGCKSLAYLNISSFNTSLVENMQNMFSGCNNLLYLELSNFDTSSVTNMRYMFANTEKLVSLDLRSFNLKKVNNMEKIFANCISLTSIEMSSFNTSLVNNFEKMFFNCTSLTSLNITNFDLSSAIDITYMFAGCINLNYINFSSFIENETLDNANMFLSTPDDLIYCIEDWTNMQNIISLLLEKECAVNDCETTWELNKDNRFEEKKKSIEIFEDKCIYKRIKDINTDFILTDKIPNTTIYSYDINSNVEELKEKYKNLTFIEFSKEQINNLKEQLNLDEGETIYLLILDTISSDSMTATSWYDYKLLFENGTELDLSNIKINLKVNISVPIRDLELSNFNEAEYFSNEGYDIYDKNDDFYNDYCLSASINGSDITINDRKKEIYPNNVTLCRSNCEYIGVNIEDKRIMCECNLIINLEMNNINETNENILNDDDGGFITYCLDNINFRPFKCGKLLFFSEKIKYNCPFYFLILILFIIIIITIEFFSYKLLKIRAYLFKESPTEQRLRQSIQIKNCQLENTKIPNRFSKSNSKKDFECKLKRIINKNKILKRKSHKSQISNKRKLLTENINCKNKKLSTASRTISNSNIVKNEIIEDEKIKKNENIQKKSDKNSKEKDDTNILNDLPFSLAIKEDRRNSFQIFKSILFDKIDIINIFMADEKIKEIIICEFILSLLISFFFNALLYSDEIVSHKYHNNGNLDFIVIFSLSILSNIITSIVCYFLKYSPLIEQRLEQIIEIKNEFDYLKTLKLFFRNLKIKIILIFITEIIVIIICFYYIIIFTIIYYKSQKSLLLNYLTSIFQDLIKSLIISFIIVLTRKVGIFCLNKYIYNTSKYINENF